MNREHGIPELYATRELTPRAVQQFEEQLLWDGIRREVEHPNCRCLPMLEVTSLSVDGVTLSPGSYAIDYATGTFTVSDIYATGRVGIINEETGHVWSAAARRLEDEEMQALVDEIMGPGYKWERLK